MQIERFNFFFLKSHGDRVFDCGEWELFGRQRHPSVAWKRLRLLPFLLHLYLMSFWTVVNARSFLLAMSSCAGVYTGISSIWNKGLQRHCWLWQSFRISFTVPSEAAKHATKSSPSRCHHWIGKQIFSAFPALSLLFTINGPVRLHLGLILFYWIRWLVLPHSGWSEMFFWMLQDGFFFFSPLTLG